METLGGFLEGFGGKKVEKGYPWRVFREKVDVGIWVDCAKGNPWKLLEGSWGALVVKWWRRVTFGGFPNQEITRN
ncbi:MAG: hypothetical protein ABI430_02290 [Candidatus Taylorbacteria bacterium]